MPTTTNREMPLRERGPVDLRLARFLDSADLARVVPHLAPETLHQLVRRCGLEACGELVTSATPAQLTYLLDPDLWRCATPGREERLDVARFGEWLEVLVDTGDAMAARTVAALDTQLVVAGLSGYVRVFDPGIFEPTASSDDEAIERHDLMNSETSRDVLECEVGGYLLRARRTDAWDAIVALLVALETEHHDRFHAVMQGCRSLSNSRPEIDGLDDLLMGQAQHLHDVATERERRRSQRGYATAADARAFLQMARRPRPAPTPNPIVAAYFRAADEDAESTAGSEPGDAAAETAHADDLHTPIDAVIELLAEAGVTTGLPRALLGAAAEPQSARLAQITRTLEFVLHRDEAAYHARRRELAFLANTLLAGCAIQSRPFTPAEASDAAAGICNLGLERWPEHRDHAVPNAFLVDHDLIAAFEVGWSVLSEDVSLWTADQLIAMLPDLTCSDADTRIGLRALRRTLIHQRAAGTPWLARDAADVLAVLDASAWTSVIGLLDECPIVPAALTAILERRTTRISPAAFKFISTTAQIDDVRVFMTMLPKVLSTA